jgi:hypothetical protein
MIYISIGHGHLSTKCSSNKRHTAKKNQSCVLLGVDSNKHIAVRARKSSNKHIEVRTRKNKTQIHAALLGVVF